MKYIYSSWSPGLALFSQGNCHWFTCNTLSRNLKHGMSHVRNLPCQWILGSDNNLSACSHEVWEHDRSGLISLQECTLFLKCRCHFHLTSQQDLAQQNSHFGSDLELVLFIWILGILRVSIWESTRFEKVFCWDKNLHFTLFSLNNLTR